ncbi:uncharacterized protein LOC116305346 [Actinia tenebrosa]|uniref:Uncharacterized protein LOC116305346 n=1 Tax=Actinia tenebrosa TaxID=6105 RepID=A0A6P8IYS8_ACTTE|nr:uncharacterized protein LOC116305346 [Actinia tenebrosa]
MQCQELWFKTGMKDKVRFLPVHAIAVKLRESVCSALPGFHALTGCDSTSGLFQVGKKKAWKAFLKDDNSQDHVGNLGTIIPPSNRTIQSCESFICSMYTTSKKAGTMADEVRYWMFCQKHQSSERLPPTSNSLRHHIQRANYQSYVWKRSLQSVQELPSPSANNGWKEVDGNLEPELMSKDPAPQSLLELTTCRCNKSVCTRDTCSCKANEMPCTEACFCMSDESCQNPYKPTDPTMESTDDELTDE